MCRTKDLDACPMHHHLPCMRRLPVLPDVDALPGSEGQFTV
ncbi:MAG: hypothetical protein RLZ45_1574, partial [Verrucomicrobiota bacterium]